MRLSRGAHTSFPLGYWHTGTLGRKTDHFQDLISKSGVSERSNAAGVGEEHNQAVPFPGCESPLLLLSTDKKDLQIMLNCGIISQNATLEG